MQWILAGYLLPNRSGLTLRPHCVFLGRCICKIVGTLQKHSSSGTRGNPYSDIYPRVSLTIHEIVFYNRKGEIKLCNSCNSTIRLIAPIEAYIVEFCRAHDVSKRCKKRLWEKRWRLAMRVEIRTDAPKFLVTPPDSHDFWGPVGRQYSQ
jgi:hypothetical protein